MYICSFNLLIPSRGTQGHFSFLFFSVWLLRQNHPNKYDVPEFPAAGEGSSAAVYCAVNRFRVSCVQGRHLFIAALMVFKLFLRRWAETWNCFYFFLLSACSFSISISGLQFCLWGFLLFDLQLVWCQILELVPEVQKTWPTADFWEWVSRLLSYIYCEGECSLWMDR